MFVLFCKHTKLLFFHSKHRLFSFITAGHLRGETGHDGRNVPHSSAPFSTGTFTAFQLKIRVVPAVDVLAEQQPSIVVDEVVPRWRSCSCWGSVTSAASCRWWRRLAAPTTIMKTRSLRLATKMDADNLGWFLLFGKFCCSKKWSSFCCARRLQLELRLEQSAKQKT